MVRIVFMGSPEFAIPSLMGLAAHFSVVGVVTQPDKPAGRGRKLSPPAVKVRAEELGIPVLQPLRLKNTEVFAQLTTWAPDVIVVAAYGKILRQNVLDLPKYGCINVHASLLPRWRGAAPIQASILHGDDKSGVSIMRMEAGLDTGPVLARRELEILPEDTGESLTMRLAELGAELLVATLPAYLAGEIEPKAQNETLATYAPMINKEEGELDFSLKADELARKVRAFNPWPGAYLDWEGGRLKVHRAHVVPEKGLESGRRAKIAKMPAVAARDGWLVLDEVQPPGKKPMPGNVFLNGARQWAADAGEE
ncbi:MAG: methionyl-tRNA formyltransferase [Anaerolineaceae bacterium]|jgi:methionyl-tRNA formyltransferase|nr:methionyl-tRNA formyltransferase [Anaerolineaceae bacterium]